MKRTFRKILSFLLAATLVFGTLAFGFADVDWSEIAIKAKAATSGTCGDSLTWNFDDETGRLTIDGTGEMYDWKSYSDTPWYNCRSYIKTVMLGDGVTSIGNCAFYNCESLTNVTIGNGVLSIGNYAFYNTGFYNSTANWKNNVLYKGKYLIAAKQSIADSYSIYNGTKVIAEGAFYGCNNLTSINIPNSITNIDDLAFNGCNNLENAYYPDTFEQWKNVTVGLANTPLISSLVFECNSERPYYASDDCGDNLIWKLYKDGELVIDGFGDMYSWEKAESLPWYRHASIIKSLTLSDGVASVGEYAFSCCNSLINVTISDSITSFLNNAFDNCYNLTYVYYKGDISDWCKIKFNSNNSNPLFYADNFICGKLIKKLVIPDGVTSIGDYAFYNACFTEVMIPDSVTSIGKSSFAGCKDLASITIPDSVISIGESAFSSCYGLTSITIPNNITVIDDYAFFNCAGLTSITIPSSVTSIGDYAFSSCLGLTSVTIPNSVTEIGDYAFYRCEGLENINIGYGVKIIGDHVLEDCNSLANINVEALNTEYSNDEYGVLFNKDKSLLIRYPMGNTRTSYSIPDSVTKIGKYSFDGCAYLNEITIPESVTSIGECAFVGTAYYEDESYWENGVLYIDNCLIYAKTSILDSYSIKENTRVVADNAFDYCESLTGIIIPESLINVGNEPFYECNNLEWVSVNSSNTAYSNDKYGILFNKNKTELVKYPSGNTEENYEIPVGVKIIKEYAFYKCAPLKEITVPDGVTTIEHRAFYNCSGLRSITLPDSVTYIGEVAFGKCYRLSDINLSSNLTVINDYTFVECVCEWLDEITIPSSVTSIGTGAFYGCRGFSTLIIPASVTFIGEEAFSYCASLEDVYYLGNEEDWSLVEIGTDNDYLKEATIHFVEKYADESGMFTYNFKNSELIVTGDIVFGDIPSWILKSVKTIIIEEGVTNIGNYAFANSPRLTSVRFPESLESVGHNIFLSCLELEEVHYPGTMLQWGDISVSKPNDVLTRNLIYECNSERPYYGENNDDDLSWILYTDGELVISGNGVMYDYGEPPYNAPWYCHSEKIKKVTISNGVTTIGDSAFRDCVNLTNVEISNSVTRIGDYAFENCTSLTSIVIPLSVTDIWSNAFKYLTKAYYPGTLSQWENIDIYVGNECLENNIILEYDSLTPYYSKGQCGDNLTWILHSDGELEIKGYGVMTLCFPTHWDSHLTQIKTVKIPEGVTVIDYSMFEGCNNITDVYFDGTKEEWEIIKIYDGNTALTSATLHYKGSPIVSPTTKPVEVPTTVKPATTKPSTTKPAEITSTTKPVEIPVTTKPVTTKPVTTKPAEEPSTTNPNIENTTDSVVTKPSTEPTKPVETPITKPSTTKPVTTKPVEIPTMTKPVVTEFSTTKPVEVPTTRPGETRPSAEPTKPVETPSATTTKPVTDESTTKPVTAEPSTVPATQPSTEQKKLFEIRKPSQTEIKYGDSIILHADFESKIPEGAKVIWSTDNANFKIVETTSSGETCIVTPNANGNTVFTATLVDADGNAIASDTQTMTAKAGFFQKIIAFFKKIFGLTKVIPEMLK